jgi:tRNA A-37 threonylcarbamoyl transferase component Bud32
MINLPMFQTDGGSFGSYYQLSGAVGVKVLHGVRFTSMKKALASRTYRLAAKEASLLCQAEESGVVPKCYGVTLVKEGNKYGVGILMQHLGTKTLSMSGACESVAYDTVNEALREIGIVHDDLHNRNIMVYRGKYYAIDFSPNFVKIVD